MLANSNSYVPLRYCPISEGLLQRVKDKPFES